MTDIATLGIKIDTNDVRKGERDLKGLENASERAERAARGIGTAFKVAGIAIIAGLAGATLALRKFVSATSEQQRVVAQLEAALKSTGGGVGYTSSQLQEMAANLQKITTYGDETIISAQSMLLTFTKIGREAFPQALEATLNVATAMGTDLKSAAIQVGKALNDPVLGVTALARSGIQFTEVQKGMIKSLVETGHAAEAQTIILRELETQFGGSARAARGTLGGSLDALGNAWGDLFELQDESVEGMIENIDNLTETLTDDNTRQAFQTFGNWLIDALDAVATAAVNTINLIDGVIQATKNIPDQSTDFLQDRLDGMDELQTRYGRGYNPKAYGLKQQLTGELGGRGLQGSFDALGGATTLSSMDELRALLTKKSSKFTLDPFETLSHGAKAANDNVIDLNKGIQTTSGSLSEWEQVGQQVTSTLADGFTNLFTGLIDGTQSAQEAIGGLLKSLGSMLINRGFQMLLGGLFGGGGGLFGGLFGGGGGGYTPGFGAYGSFDTGGYTGNAPINQAAGIVHGQEYVLNAAATRAIGRPALDAMNSGRMPANNNTPSAANGNAPVVQIIDQRQRGSIKQETNTGPNGEKQLRLIIRDEVTQARNRGALGFS